MVLFGHLQAVDTAVDTALGRMPINMRVALGGMVAAGCVAGLPLILAAQGTASPGRQGSTVRPLRTSLVAVLVVLAKRGLLGHPASAVKAAMGFIWIGLPNPAG